MVRAGASPRRAVNKLEKNSMKAKPFHRFSRIAIGALGLAIAMSFASGCSSSAQNDANGTGGRAGSGGVTLQGGSPGIGGAVAGHGGTVVTGSTSSSGGAIGTGGKPGSGGATDSGGTCGETLATATAAAIPSDGRFLAGSIGSPLDGYTDSIFVNPAGDRIYFTHSFLTTTDFIGVTTNQPHGATLPGQTLGAGLDYNTDLYYVEWNGTAWSAPTNLGSAIDGTKINSLGNECCVWLDDSETEIIFYRDTFELSALGPRGNYRATRADRNAAWGTPVLLSGKYGSLDQSTTRYRHDLQKTASGDLYLWEKDGDTSTLQYGKCDGQGGNDAPVLVPGMEALGVQHNTQPWISRDELTLLFNTRTTGDTTLNRMTRPNRCTAWGNLTTVPITSFGDPSGVAVWGEPSFSRAENYMLFIRFDTSQTGWPAQMMFSKGEPATGFQAPVKLN
jgi:hypothetical protein